MARRKSSLPNRLINLGLLLFAFSPALTEVFRGGDFVNRIMDLYSAGLVRGKFNKEFALRAYAPVGISFALFEVKKMAMKKFRF